MDADDFAAFCEELAKQTPNKPIDHEHGYEEELEERWRRAQKGASE